MKSIKVAAAVIVRDSSGKKELFATQRGHGSYKDYWEFPGGKVEEGETPEEALAREIREELGIGIEIREPFHQVEFDYPDFHLSMDCFLCSIDEEPQLLEHEAARWLPLDELFSVNWLPADFGVLEKLQRSTPVPVIRSIASKTCHIYGTVPAETLLIQPVDEHDLQVLESEVSKIIELSGRRDFTLAAFMVEDWNNDLTPWEAPAVFGKEGFGAGAEKTLSFIKDELIPELAKGKDERIYLGGYSLAGLFSLWAAYETDIFKGACGASPSVWYPKWMEFIRSHGIKTDNIYLSLGDREEKVKNQVVQKVGENIRAMYDFLENEGACRTVLQWNQGNHFVDSDLRTARGFAWLLTQN